MKKHQIVFSIVIFLLCYSFNLQNIYAQNDLSPKEIVEAVDSLFTDKNNIASPGASVIILEGERVVLSKNYGSSNLTFGIPFDNNTKFPLEGFTEQLVVFSILQLEKKGRINLNDSVNKYLPEIGFSNQVSLFHLLNHSSGFPEISSLRLIAGWNILDPFTHDDFLIIAKGFAPDLSPDKKMIHTHGGIKILMMVVENVSGISFSKYAKANIFEPLNMNDTSVKDKSYCDDKNNSVGYIQSITGYDKIVTTPIEVICPISNFTQSDFIKWMTNVQTKRFHGDIIERMNEPLTINGKLQERTYGAYCIGQQQYRSYLGKDEFYMRETGNGYSWMWLQIPQSKLSVFVVGNLDDYIGAQVNGIADLLVYNDSPLSSNIEDVKSTPLELSEREMELCAGFYWNEKYLYTTEISVKEGKLYHSDKDNGFNFQLIPRTKTLFVTPFGGTIEFSNIEGNQKKMRNVIPNGRVFDSKQYDVDGLKEGDQLKYQGIYYSDKLKIFYQVVWENNKLIFRRNRKPDLELTPIGNHQFRVPEVDFRLIEFKENIHGEFQIMNISNTAVENIEFQKI